ncbi:ROK family protein [Aquibacillus halophilus]|uniref:ROK family protein n=1 Tax=Aquibacillus halophilus TaxID=930132 RepID=A0A6A8DMB5_9BACI|nr:ROK family protein [Aquibacillus halophilus]MRH44951.1 ROK family protein [Aquibacillus halophilus]
MKQYIAFDIGGTYVKYALIQEDALIIENGKKKTPSTLEGLISLIENHINQYKTINLEGIAISAPGAVSDEGIIYGSSALPYLHGPNIKKLVSERTEMDVYIENDANCAGLAEIWNGSAKGKKDVLAVVLGTGIGGAVIKDGSLHKGANLHGGEFGYMVMDAKQTTWSGVAATGALVKNVTKIKGAEPGTLNGEIIFKLAEEGDTDCLNAIDEFYHMLAAGIYNLQYIYDPELILIGGGISARDDLVDNINLKLKKIMEAVKVAKIVPNIEVCKYRQNANLLGAVYGFIKEN